MSRPRALVAGIHHWHTPTKVGTHYIVEYLLGQGFEVAYISAPITPLHRFLSPNNDLFQRRRNHASDGEYLHGGRLWHYVPYALIAPDNRPLLSSSPVLRYWQKASRPGLLNKVKSKGFTSVDVLFMDTIYQSFWLNALPHRASAYRLADNTAGFDGFGGSTAKVESNLVRSVDRVFVASKSLLAYSKERGAKQVQVLPNGVDYTRFERNDISEIELPEISGPVAIYVGAMKYWFDHDAIVALALARQDLTIILVGPLERPDPRYANLPNVRIIGPIPPDWVPAYLSIADVGLIPFRVETYPQLINDVNPLKLYEYMAAGLPVVASRWKELTNLNSPAHLADDINTFVERVSLILDARPDGAQERSFARQFDWSSTLKPLGTWLGEVNEPASNYSFSQ